MDVSRWWISLDGGMVWEDNNTAEPLNVFRCEFGYLRLDYEAWLLAVL